jgi:hypothetical protein
MWPLRKARPRDTAALREEGERVAGDDWDKQLQVRLIVPLIEAVDDLRASADRWSACLAALTIMMIVLTVLIALLTLVLANEQLHWF